MYRRDPRRCLLDHAAEAAAPKLGLDATIEEASVTKARPGIEQIATVRAAADAANSQPLVCGVSKSGLFIFGKNR